MTPKSQLIEEVAQIIYRTQGGASNEEEFKMLNGGEMRTWRLEGRRWDSDPKIELCEWERDDYRFQATKILEALKLI